MGSANWDPRSLRLNFEFNVECYDVDLACQVEAIIAERRQAARSITVAALHGLPALIRFRNAVLRLASPYL